MRFIFQLCTVVFEAILLRCIGSVIFAFEITQDLNVSAGLLLAYQVSKVRAGWYCNF